jgi:elongation factor P hydroxylase
LAAALNAQPLRPKTLLWLARNFHSFTVSVMTPVTAHRIEDLITLFDGLFSHSFNTRLVRGDVEPVYLPCSDQVPYHQVIFAHGFFSSALHEVAHWCIAGARRRQMVDFGYWYAPDGRSAAQQNAFEQVEVRPQALEWIFSRAAGSRFFISVDNLGGEETDPEPFRRDVLRQAISYCRDGLPARAAQFCEALSAFYGTSAVLDADQFKLDAL